MRHFVLIGGQIRPLIRKATRGRDQRLTMVTEEVENAAVTLEKRACGLILVMLTPTLMIFLVVVFGWLVGGVLAILLLAISCAVDTAYQAASPQTTTTTAQAETTQAMN